MEYTECSIVKVHPHIIGVLLKYSVSFPATSNTLDNIPSNNVRIAPGSSEPSQFSHWNNARTAKCHVEEGMERKGEQR